MRGLQCLSGRRLRNGCEGFVKEIWKKKGRGLDSTRLHGSHLANPQILIASPQARERLGTCF